MKDGYYYIGYGWGTDCTLLDDYIRQPIPTYKEALEKALESHKQELVYQRGIGNKKGEVMNTYVVLYDHGEYEVAVISGWKSRITEYEYED